MAADRELKVLVIDDSAFNRKLLTDFMGGVSGVRVVGKASDGEEGLKMALTLKPDAITLDLEMPRMDGFTFLRFLMAANPTPVIVISSYASSENVFRALELGALDFVAKPSHRASPAIEEIREEVVRKVMLARNLKTDRLTTIPPPSFAEEHTGGPRPTIVERPSGRRSRRAVEGRSEVDEQSAPRARKVVVVVASTGGPAALTSLLTELPADLDAAIAIAQHMPPRFTTTFAERLDKLCRLRVKEAGGIEPLRAGMVYVCPGDGCLELIRDPDGLAVRVTPGEAEDRYVPSGDRLFCSAAQVGGPDVLAVVLTGMGSDGAEGARAVAEAHGRVIVEDERSAVIHGMPGAAIATGVADRILPLDRIARQIVDFSRD